MSGKHVYINLHPKVRKIFIPLLKKLSFCNNKRIKNRSHKAQIELIIFLNSTLPARLNKPYLQNTQVVETKSSLFFLYLFIIACTLFRDGPLFSFNLHCWFRGARAQIETSPYVRVTTTDLLRKLQVNLIFRFQEIHGFSYSLILRNVNSAAAYFSQYPDIDIIIQPYIDPG